MILHLCYVHWIAAQTYDGSNSNLTTIPIDIPLTTVNLFLQVNFITDVPDFQFSSHTALQVVNLEENVINSISNSAFCSTNVKTLRLGYNKLWTFPDVTCISSTLKQFNLNDNGIADVPSTLLHPLTALTSISISGNSLTTVPDFSYRKWIYYISIAYNNFPGPITSELEKVKYPKFLQIGRTQIPDFRTVSGSWYRILQFLEVDFSSMPEDIFSTIPTLTELKYGMCDFLSLPVVSTTSKEQIITMLLSKNANHTLDNLELMGYSNLQKLTVVEYYHLTEIPLFSLPSLSELYLASNNITGFIEQSIVSQLLHNSLALDTLDLQNNSITGIGDVSDLICATDRNINVIDLRSNPLLCSCELAWLNNLGPTCAEVRLPNPACYSSEGNDLSSLTPCPISTTEFPDVASTSIVDVESTTVTSHLSTIETTQVGTLKTSQASPAETTQASTAEAQASTEGTSQPSTVESTWASTKGTSQPSTVESTWASTEGTSQPSTIESTHAIPAESSYSSIAETSDIYSPESSQTSPMMTAGVSSAETPHASTAETSYSSTIEISDTYTPETSQISTVMAAGATTENTAHLDTAETAPTSTQGDFANVQSSTDIPSIGTHELTSPTTLHNMKTNPDISIGSEGHSDTSVLHTSAFPHDVTSPIPTSSRARPSPVSAQAVNWLHGHNLEQVLDGKEGTCTITGCDSRPWIEIQLSGTTLIKGIFIKGRMYSF